MDEAIIDLAISELKRRGIVSVEQLEKYGLTREQITNSWSKRFFDEYTKHPIHKGKLNGEAQRSC